MSGVVLVRSHDDRAHADRKPANGGNEMFTGLSVPIPSGLASVHMAMMNGLRILGDRDEENKRVDPGDGVERYDDVEHHV